MSARCRAEAVSEEEIKIYPVDDLQEHLRVHDGSHHFDPHHHA